MRAGLVAVVGFLAGPNVSILKIRRRLKSPLACCWGTPDGQKLLAVKEASSASPSDVDHTRGGVMAVNVALMAVDVALKNGGVVLFAKWRCLT